ncbi:MAG: AAA family ATPase [Clostridia bacterium]|nr:AAA family ATPase [Clostridia bacterium]
MIIESIRIDSFGRLSGVDYTFGEGLTIIEGDNESGKSTLAAFIRYMLYGFPDARGSELAEKKKRIDWQSGRAAGSMVIRVGEKRYRIERVTTVSTGARARETYRDTETIVDLENNTLLPPDGESPGERFLSVPEAVFMQTAFIGQIGPQRPDGSKLTSAIENLLFSGDEQTNLPRALSKLDELRRALHHKRGSGGALQELESKKAALETRLATAREQNAALLSAESELVAVRRERQTKEEEGRTAKAAETLSRNISLVRSYDRLHAAEEKLAAAEAALIGMDGMPSHRLSERDLTDLAVARRATEDAARRLADATEDYEQKQQETISPETTALLRRTEGEGGIDAIAAYGSMLDRRRRTCLLSGIACGVLGILALLLGLLVPALSAQKMLLLLPGGLLCAAAALAFALFAARRNEQLALCRSYGVAGQGALLEKLAELRSAAQSEQTLLAEARLAEEKLRTAELEYRRAAGELDTVVRRFDTRLPNGETTEFLDRLAEAARAVLEKKKLREQDRAAAAAAVETLRAGLRGTNEAAARAALPEGELPAEEELKTEELHARAEYAAAQCRILAERERELENKTVSMRSRIEDPAVLESALDGLQDKLTAENERYAAVLLACEALSGAGERLRAEISPRLSGFACRLLSDMTGGKYASVGVGSDLSMTVGTDGGTRTPEWLSAGTQDLVYLSLRMALIDLLYREKPPVCFDESFAHQDDIRLGRALRALAEIAEEGQQCLLFTCHAREREQAQQAAPGATVIRLS